MSWAAGEAEAWRLRDEGAVRCRPVLLATVRRGVLRRKDAHRDGSVISFTVYGQAAPAGSKTRASSPDGTRTWVRDSSKKSYPWKQRVEQVAGETMAGKPLIEGPLLVELHFHAPRPKGHFGVNGLKPSAPAFPIVAPDVLKLARAVEDALQGVCFRNDAQIVCETLMKSYGEPARCEVRISRMHQQTLSPGTEKAA